MIASAVDIVTYEAKYACLLFYSYSCSYVLYDVLYCPESLVFELSWLD